MISEELSRKANVIFAQAKNSTILTGWGLSRKELRKLEREGLIEKQLMKHKETGQVIYQWKPVSPAEGLVAKKFKKMT